jgi:hypothetical protein
VILKRRATRAEIQAFAARWQLVNRAEECELRQTSATQKLRQLAALMASAGDFGWREGLAAEDEEVRRRWQQLRSADGRS